MAPCAPAAPMSGRPTPSAAGCQDHLLHTNQLSLLAAPPAVALHRDPLLLPHEPSLTGRPGRARAWTDSLHRRRDARQFRQLRRGRDPGRCFRVWTGARDQLALIAPPRRPNVGWRGTPTSRRASPAAGTPLSASCPVHSALAPRRTLPRDERAMPQRGRVRGRAIGGHFVRDAAGGPASTAKEDLRREVARCRRAGSHGQIVGSGSLYWVVGREKVRGGPTMHDVTPTIGRKRRPLYRPPPGRRGRGLPPLAPRGNRRCGATSQAHRNVQDSPELPNWYWADDEVGAA